MKNNENGNYGPAGVTVTKRVCRHRNTGGRGFYRVISNRGGGAGRKNISRGRFREVRGVPPGRQPAAGPSVSMTTARFGRARRRPVGPDFGKRRGARTGRGKTPKSRRSPPSRTPAPPHTARRRRNNTREKRRTRARPSLDASDSIDGDEGP